ncbi:MAG: hypothetical protein ACI4VE_01270 [Clostridia bacterium]
MIKSVIKEIGIILLLFVVIVLITAFVFYDYNPINKTIPSKVDAYVLPEEVEQEIETILKEEDKIVKTYQIDGKDLNTYKNNNEYNPGKIEPYSLQSSKAENEELGNNSTINNTSGGNFFNIVGK